MIKKLTPSQMELYSGIFFSVAALAVCIAMLLPQYKLSHAYAETPLSPQDSKLPILEQLPVVSPDHATLWENHVAAPIHKISTDTHTQVTLLYSDFKEAHPIDVLPPTVRKIPVILGVKGTYPDIQAFQKQLTRQFPQTVFHSMSFDVSPEVAVLPEHSPLVESTFKFDLIVTGF